MYCNRSCNICSLYPCRPCRIGLVSGIWSSLRTPRSHSYILCPRSCLNRRTCKRTCDRSCTDRCSSSLDCSYRYNRLCRCIGIRPCCRNPCNCCWEALWSRWYSQYCCSSMCRSRSLRMNRCSSTRQARCRLKKHSSRKASLRCRMPGDMKSPH